jgi:hypothetical protein
VIASTTPRLRVKGLSSDENALLNHLVDDLAARRPRNWMRASYYDGKQAARRFGSGVVPEQYFKLGIVLGWSAKAVDILARRCNLDSFIWPGGTLSDIGYDEVWDDNFFGAESSSGIVSSLIHGPAFLINTTGGDGEPDSLIHVKDAMNAIGDWNPRIRGLGNLLSINDRDGDGKITSFALYLNGETITAQRATGWWGQSNWSVDRQEHDWGVPAEALVYKPRVGRPFGSSRISRHAIAIHNRALRTLVRMEGHADIFSYPELWMLGADLSVFEDEHGNRQPTWQVMMGRIKGIPDDDEQDNPALARADVKQFQQASPQPHIDMLEKAATDFAGETDLPVSALGVQAKTNSTTADGSDNAEKQLIAEAEGATDDWSWAFGRSMRRALAIKNGIRSIDSIPPDWAAIKPKWRPHAYLSRAAAADAGAKQVAAVPWLAETEVGLELIGLTAQQIKSALADRRRAQSRALIGQLTAPVPPPPAGATEQASADSGANTV